MPVATAANSTKGRAVVGPSRIDRGMAPRVAKAAVKNDRRRTRSWAS